MRQELQFLVDQLEAMKPTMPLYNLTTSAILFHEEIRTSILWIQGLQEWYNKVEDEHWRMRREMQQSEAAQRATAQRMELLESEALYPEAFILNRPKELGVRRGRRVPEELKLIVQVQEGHTGPKTYTYNDTPYDQDATPLYAQQFPKLRAFEQPVKELLETGMTGNDWADYVPLPEIQPALPMPGFELEPEFQDINYQELRGKKAQPANELIFDPDDTEEDESKLRSTWERVDFHDPAEPCPRCHRNPVVCLCTPPTELDEMPDRRVENLEAMWYTVRALEQKIRVAEDKLKAFEGYRSKDKGFEAHRLRKIQHLANIIKEAQDEIDGPGGWSFRIKMTEEELIDEGEISSLGEYEVIDGRLATYNPEGIYVKQEQLPRERDDAPYAANDFMF